MRHREARLQGAARRSRRAKALARNEIAMLRCQEHRPEGKGLTPLVCRNGFCPLWTGYQPVRTRSDGRVHILMNCAKCIVYYTFRVE